jgi:hypothetical protein
MWLLHMHLETVLPTLQHLSPLPVSKDADRISSTSGVRAPTTHTNTSSDIVGLSSTRAKQILKHSYCYVPLLSEL